MKRMVFALILYLSVAFLWNAPSAWGGDDRQVPDKVTMEHWTCREIAELAVKYDAERRLPEAVVAGGKSCDKTELARCLLSVMEKVVTRCEVDGPDAVALEDRDRIALLHEALRSELSQFEGYLVRREAIERILARPEVPPFEYRLGVGGFLRGEGASNFTLRDFSYTPGHGEGRFLYRVKPYGVWHPTGYLGFHLEGQGYGFAGPGEDFHKYSLYQGYLEAALPKGEWLAFKGGRQEIAYGSAFLLGGDTFFDGLSYDAAKLTVKPMASLAVDLFWGRYATPFSDGVEGTLSGAYVTWTFSEETALELYALRDTGSLNRRSGEKRYSWGFRGAAKFGPLSLELEPVYQSGQIFNELKEGNDRIDAYGGHLDIACETTFLGFGNKFFAGYALGSGDRAAAEGTEARNEFANPNNDTSLTGDMSVVWDLSGLTVSDFHASGLQIYTLGWGIDITRELNFSATGRYFIARFVPDGFSRHLGLETDFTITYTMNDDLSLILGYDRFFTGRFFRDAAGGGGDIDYGYAMLQFNLAKTKPKAARRAS